MSAVSDSNDMFAMAIREQVLALVPKCLFAAAEAAYAVAVSYTIQDSGEAAASWNVSTSSSDYLNPTSLPLSAFVGLKGEHRSLNGSEQIVIGAQKGYFTQKLPVYEYLIGVNAVFISNSTKGAHEANARTIPAGQYALIAAREAVEIKIQEFGNAFQ